MSYDKMDQITDIVIDFDYEKVVDVMTYLNWTWCVFTEEDTYERVIPDKYMLRDRLKSLLIQVYDLKYCSLKEGESSDCFISGGGFYVFARSEEGETSDNIVLNAMFCIEEVGNC